MNTRSESFSPGFMVLHGNRLEDLRDLLVDVIRAYPLPVLSPEIILVQNNGMKHWLELSLASDEAFGICAATRIELPSSYLWGVYRSILSDVQIPVHMPFDKKNLIWRLYKILPQLIEDESYRPLKNYLHDSADCRRLYQLATQISDVFDGYQNYRADWLTDWALGIDQLRGDSYLKNPSKPRLLNKDEIWQSKLWRAIRADIGAELAEASRASVHAQYMVKMESVIEQYSSTKQRPKGIPQRVVIFGISSLPPQVIEAFAKLGEICQVFMFVQNPCQSYWGDIVDGHEMLRTLSKRRQSKQIDDLHMSSHPLLASWGKQGRDYFHLLDEFDHLEVYKGKLEKVLKKVDVFVDPVTLDNGEPTQLVTVQSAVLNLTEIPTPEKRLCKAEHDHSIQFVSAHSAQREVEILHDQLLSWFDRDASLRPENVMVMVPDTEEFLPHIKAVFGRFKLGESRYIPYSIADATPKETPIVRALTQLLSLPTLKISVVDWMNLFEVDAVCQRFELTSAEVEQLKTWIVGAGVRWGLGREHRVQHGLDKDLVDLEQNTWAFGLRRLLLGYAIGSDQSWEGTLAYSGVNGLDGPLISKLLLWLEAVERTNAELRADHCPSEWVQLFKSLIERFFKASDDAQERLLEKIFTPIEQWERVSNDCKLETPIPLNVVRDYWLSQLQEVGLQQRFFGGGVQFGTLMPMRSIPFKIICLLGMNDGDFPRQTSSRDFDLMMKNWRTGDRSRREDDRYLFLEAMLCARQKLYVSWQGHSARDNSAQQPSVLVAQLIDYLNAVWKPEVSIVKHPLQPFSKSYFDQDSSLYTYDSDWQLSDLVTSDRRVKGVNGGKDVKGALNLQGELVEDRINHAGINDQTPKIEKIELSELQRLLRNPVEIFFRSRLNISIDKLEDDVPETESFVLNNLEKFNIANQLLRAESLETGLKNLALSGQLPLAGQGKALSLDLEAKVSQIKAQCEEYLKLYPKLAPSLVLCLDIGGTVLEGTVANLWAQEDPISAGVEYLQIDQRVGSVTQKRKGVQTPKGHIITKAWINHLVVNACGHKLTSVQIGSDAQVVMEPLSQQTSIEILRTLVGVYKEALERPLPVACKTGLGWLQSDNANQLALSQGLEQKTEDSHEIAEEIFDPATSPKDGPKGERMESLYLMRAFLSYEELREELPQNAQKLYADMLKAALIKPTSTQPPAAQGEEQM